MDSVWIVYFRQHVGGKISILKACASEDLAEEYKSERKSDFELIGSLEIKKIGFISE